MSLQHTNGGFGQGARAYCNGAANSTHGAVIAIDQPSMESLWQEYFTDAIRWPDKRRKKARLEGSSKTPVSLEGASEECRKGGESRSYGDDSDGNSHFERLQRRNQFSWTSQISGYINLKLYKEALNAYEQMQKEGVKPSTYTFVYALKACIGLGDLQTGKKIHAHVIESGNESQMFVATMLVDMYVKCGSMVDAHNVFDNLPHRDVVSFTAMILGCTKKEQGEVALHMYARMQQEGIPPNERTFIGALKACSTLATMEGGTELDRRYVKLQCLEKGRSIHSQVVKSGFQSNAFVGNTLIDMYAKCGSLADSQHTFDMLPHCDVVSWNAIILGYAENQESEVALQLYAQMLEEGIAPNERTYVGVLKACGSLAVLEHGKQADEIFLRTGCLEKARATHSQVVKDGFESDVFVGTMLVDTYEKCESMVDSGHVFEMLPLRDEVLWTAMILGYAQREEGEVALQLYAQMQEEGVVPVDRTFVGALKACSSLARQEKATEVDGKFLKQGCLQKGRAIHSQVVKSGFESDVFVGTTLVDMYANCGSMADARRVFDRLPHCEVAPWTAMILSYAEHGENDEAFSLYMRMQGQGLSPNIVTFVSILKACGNMAALETGRQIHAHSCRSGLEATDIILATALIDMYGKCGSMVDAQQVFDALHQRELVTWNALIAGYARQGEDEVVFHLFERMRQEGIQPNGVTFLGILTLCSHAGLVEKGQEYFHAMSNEYGLTPTLKHYSCMVDLLGRAGQMDEVSALVETMPLQPNVVTWMTVLGACRKWTDVVIGRQAFLHVVRLDKNNAAAYVLMSNIYADAHMWEDRVKVQSMRERARVRKKPGQSWWTDNGGTVHTFAAGDTKHPQIEDICAKLKDISEKLKVEGYVPDLDCVLWDICDDEKEDMLCGHSEKLAIMCALINTAHGAPIRIVKNLRVCDDCHKAIALISKMEARQIICRDASRFHVYNDGHCSCGGYW